MQLKRLQLVGFKTFADKTEIELSEGITAVVGPNGCGKSNIADALLWVMGEQNPRLLRGAESRDVIFSGTDRRKRLGMAEVRLTVDNTDKALPIDFAEVTVTRRIYRSGESQYLLNNSPCRLKDIVELFLDTGVGKGAYSFVSQSEIDAVLSARAEDRRELFEEAAGIKKYRVKKREAVRRLEAAESNLMRIRDIAIELDQQRAPMEEQAVRARRYLELSERLGQIEVDLLVGDVQQADYELYAERTSRSADEASIRELDATLGELERESAAIGVSLAEAERELDSARLIEQAAMTAVERMESQLQLARERELSSEKTAETLDHELKDLSERIAQFHQEMDSLRRRLERMDAQESEGRDKLAALRARLRELDTAHKEELRTAEDRQGTMRRMAEERARRETALGAAKARLAETSARLEGAVRDLSNISAAETGERERLQELMTVRDAAVRRADEIQRKRTELETGRMAVLQKVRDVSGRLESSRRVLAERQSRLATLTELQESGEGFYQGVRAVLSAARKGELRGSYAPVVDLLTVPEDLRIAIEVALGGSAQDIVCDSEQEAKSAIEWLKSRRAGRATFLALPLLRPGSPLTPSAVNGFPGLLGVASERVEVKSQYRPVVDLLLGRVLLASTMDDAVQAARRLQGGWSRIVTLDGELLSPSGALTGGSLGGRGAHLVGRKGEIDDLRKSMTAIQKQAEEDHRSLELTRAEAETTENSLAETNRHAAAALAEAAGAEKEWAASDREVQRLASDRSNIQSETERLKQTVDALASEIAAMEKDLSAAHLQDLTADDAIAEAAVRAQALAEERDRIRSEAVRQEVESGRAAEKSSACRRELRALEGQVEQARRLQNAKLSQREAAGSQFADAHLMERDLEKRLVEAREHLTESSRHFGEWRDRRQERLTASFEIANAIKERTRDRAARQQSMHESELKIARMEVRLAQTVQRLSEEYGISQEEALARPSVTDTPRETVNEVARLRREIRQMGNVNTGAAEEFERLTERYEFLEGQRADLEQARVSILATIAEIDESTRGSFLETFQAVSAEFSRLFSRLFGGGTTELVLTTPDDLLETGIEVIAQPPGKKPQHLSLLSGGERALTAVALLFSFLSVRPSPFVLLDEVDAPLDGANVEKFVRLVQDFSENTQFLIITHNPTTMEAAPRWYGVTMRDPGVSSILAYRVPQESIESEPESAVVLTGAR